MLKYIVKNLNQISTDSFLHRKLVLSWITYNFLQKWLLHENEEFRLNLTGAGELITGVEVEGESDHGA